MARLPLTTVSYGIARARSSVLELNISLLSKAREHGVVPDRFHSELFQKAQGLLTKFNKNPGQKLKTSCDQNFYSSYGGAKTLGNNLVCTYNKVPVKISWLPK